VFMVREAHPTTNIFVLRKNLHKSRSTHFKPYLKVKTGNDGIDSDTRFLGWMQCGVNASALRLVMSAHVVIVRRQRHFAVTRERVQIFKTEYA
jgi:hypothetical protein